MLRKARRYELDALLESFWPIALDLTRSTYPTYTDGVKTCADFAQAVRKAHAADWGEVLVHVRGGVENALIVIDRADEDFLSLHVCLTRTHQPECLAEVLAHLRAEYPGKMLWLGFAPENTQMLAFARENGFRLMDDAVNWNMPLAGWRYRIPELPVTRIGRGNYAAFRALWTDADMYWNAERIAGNMDSWNLFVMADGSGAAACMKDAQMPEIFGFQYRDGYDEGVHRALMTACLNASAKAAGAYLTYFAAPEESGVMEALGFRRVSAYQCYETML